MNNFEYTGSGKIKLSSKTLYVVQIDESTVFYIIEDRKTHIGITPESVYSYYFSRFKNIVLLITSNTFNTFLSFIKSNNSITISGGI